MIAVLTGATVGASASIVDVSFGWDYKNCMSGESDKQRIRGVTQRGQEKRNEGEPMRKQIKSKTRGD